MNEVTYKYIVFEADSTMKTYLQGNNLGITLFNEGRALNCKKLSDSIVSENGLCFSITIYCLLVTRTDNNEYNDVMKAGLNVVKEFENSQLFTEYYTT